MSLADVALRTLAKMIQSGDLRAIDLLEDAQRRAIEDITAERDSAMRDYNALIASQARHNHNIEKLCREAAPYCTNDLLAYRLQNVGR